MIISLIIYPKELEELTFKEISVIIKKNRPKKRWVIAKWTKLMTLKEEANKSIIAFLHWLADIVNLKD